MKKNIKYEFNKCSVALLLLSALQCYMYYVRTLQHHLISSSEGHIFQKKPRLGEVK